MTTCFSALSDIGSANISTPVIIMGLVPRSIRSHAVSTRDIGSRVARVRAVFALDRPPVGFKPPRTARGA